MNICTPCFQHIDPSHNSIKSNLGCEIDLNNCNPLINRMVQEFNTQSFESLSIITPLSKPYMERRGLLILDTSNPTHCPKIIIPTTASPSKLLKWNHPHQRFEHLPLGFFQSCFLGNKTSTLQTPSLTLTY
jgi:hypothetical protein